MRGVMFIGVFAAGLGMAIATTTPEAIIGTRALLRVAGGSVGRGARWSTTREL